MANEPTNDLWEAMSTMRAMRRLKPDPVPDELINKILQAGQWAPSGGDGAAGDLGELAWLVR